jgi:MFS superfamily sulfate permease-like transporter
MTLSHAESGCADSSDTLRRRTYSLGNTNYFVFALGVVAILVLVLGERMLPGRPVALSVVALLTAAASMLGLPSLGVATTGEFPAGLPALGAMYRDNLDDNGAERPILRASSRHQGCGD